MRSDKAYSKNGNSFDNQIQFLNDFGLSHDQIEILLAAGIYLENVGGPKLETYWTTDHNKMSMRDEYFLSVNFMVSLISVAHLDAVEEWKLKFDIPYMFQIKANIQTAKSIDYLVTNHCYSDAFALSRVLHSRLNQLLLFSLNPYLFDDWMNNPNDSKFLDGRIRKELENNGIQTMPHIYEFASELIHGQYTAFSEIGHLNKGIFVADESVAQKIYVLSKFIFSMIGYAMLSVGVVDQEDRNTPKLLSDREEIFKIIKENTLVGNDIRNIFSIVAEDRHWVKVGKNKFNAGKVFNYNFYREQVSKFHRKTGQRKTLSKEYRT